MTQKERILEYLESGKLLTRVSSWEVLGVIEAPARISELRHEGYLIKTTMVSVFNRYGERVRVAGWRVWQAQKSR
jgi:hypothetical protein